LMTQIGQELVVVSELHSTQTKLSMFPKSFFSSASTINKKTKCINFFIAAAGHSSTQYKASNLVHFLTT
jgi:hypothetical protein